MLCAGIDVGHAGVKIVLLDDGRKIQDVVLSTGDQPAETVRSAWRTLGVEREKIDLVVATGWGRMLVQDADGFVGLDAASARAAYAFEPSAPMALDVGSHQARAVKIGPSGEAMVYTENDRCGSGIGALAESMARALEIGLKDICEVGQRSTGLVSMQAQCVIFAESEMRQLIKSGTPKPEVASAVCQAISGQIMDIILRLGAGGPVVFMGGVSKFDGVISQLMQATGFEYIRLPIPRAATAFGAALLGYEGRFSTGSDAA